MRLPSGYGQVVKLKGKRRRPYAVRVNEGAKEVAPNEYRPVIRYLEYFEKRSDAMEYLAKYNAGIVVEKKPAVASLPTFEAVYIDFMKYYEAKNKTASQSAFTAYETAFKNASTLHKRRFVSIKTDDLQKVLHDHAHMSKSSACNLIKLFHGMYKYAMINEIAERDYSAYVFPEFTQKEKEAHRPFEESEIATLWKFKAASPLIMVYTGLRVTEFLTIENANINLDARTMRGGIKTKAGKNRIIPIHEAIVPFVADMMNNGKYLYGGNKKIDRENFVNKEWAQCMTECGLSHIPHDTRHTAATLMERYGVSVFHQKLILGHSIQDITQGVYTHVDPAALVEDINKIPAFH